MLQRTSKFSVFAGPPTAVALDGGSEATQTAPPVEPAKRVPSGFGADYEACRDVYDTIFVDIPSELSCKASLSDREAMKVKRDYTLTYGELADMEPMWRVISTLINETHLNPEAVRRFYDLGSGSGRPVVSAALILVHFARATTSGVAPMECIGVELLPGLYELSLSAKQVYDTLPTPSDGPRPALTFHLGSIFDLHLCDWTDGDLVYVNSTCFDVKMMLQIYAIAERMKVGSVIITLSRSMVEIGALAWNIRNQCVTTQTEEAPLWQLLFETRERMSW